MKILRVVPVLVLLSLAAPGCQKGAPKSTSSARGETIVRAPLADILKTHTPELLKIEGVTGTGEGQDGGEAVFVIFVAHDTPELRAKLPVSVEDYRVVVRESGEVHADGH
jgi:hypothetical protein